MPKKYKDSYLDLYLVTLTIFFSNAFFLLVGPLYVNLAKDKGLSDSLIGVIIGMFSVAGFFATLVTPEIAKHMPRKTFS